jgi:hypothetical protein
MDPGLVSSVLAPHRRSIALAGSRAEFRVPLLVGRYAEVHSQRSSAGVGSLRLAIPIGHLYFCEFFHLGKPSLNDDPHSKPITKSNGVVRRQLQAMAADDGRQTWDPLPYRSRNSFFANWVLRSSLQ